MLVDVRRFPTSRRYPHFAREPLAGALGKAGIGYRHEPDMGGWRTPREDSPNGAWRSRGFQGYADHMDSPAFRAALDRLVADAPRQLTTIMCAEVTPWRCHRQLIADALVARGLGVIHVVGPGRTEPHSLNPHACVLADGRLTYPSPPPEQAGLFGDEGGENPPGTSA
ncbi:MAG: DUF488 domain-containing protein [Gemmatimonadetes bacterium]|nr:DUF488 domain-containing protein [Gemmatimonadota bacterium]